METALGATKRFWPGATERWQISLTVWALTSRKLTLAWTLAEGEASLILYRPFRAFGTGLSVQHTQVRQARVDRRTGSRYHPLTLFTRVRGIVILRS